MGAWGLAPAYDLTGGVPSAALSGDARRDWTNMHALAINGKNSNITDEDLLVVADRFAIGNAAKILATVKAVFI